MKELKSSIANDLVLCLKEVLNDRDVPTTNLVGFSSDTTNVMFSRHHSVVSILKSEHRNEFFVKCSCHLINLVASKSCLKLSRTVEDLF